MYYQISLFCYCRCCSSTSVLSCTVEGKLCLLDPVFFLLLCIILPNKIFHDWSCNSEYTTICPLLVTSLNISHILSLTAKHCICHCLSCVSIKLFHVILPNYLPSTTLSYVFDVANVVSQIKFTLCKTCLWPCGHLAEVFWGSFGQRAFYLNRHSNEQSLVSSCLQSTVVPH